MFQKLKKNIQEETILWDLGQDYEAPGKDGSSISSSSVYFEV